VAVNYGSLPFEEQIRFFRQKTNLGTRAWTDIFNAQHDHSFVVAGATKRALLTDLRNAVDRVIADGIALEQFKKDFLSIAAKNGWTGWKGEGSKKGEAWRARVIYDTNLRTSYAAGRRAQMKSIASSMPYWRYRHNDSVENPRPEHLAWDGLVLRSDDPFWKTHYPPNGWGCQCYVEPLDDADLKKEGKAGPDQAPPIEMEEKIVGQKGPTPRLVRTPKGIDPGFGYQPGESWMDTMVPRPIESESLLPSASREIAKLDALPAARAQAASRVLPDSLTDVAYVDAFMREFGVRGGERTIFRDVAGEYLLVSDALFRDHAGKLKIGKRDRARNVLLLADAVKLPDEVWEDFADYGGKKISRRRYLARFSVKGSETLGLAVFETGPEGWIGTTAFSPGEADYLERAVRRGARVYRRND
jgi:hypothetical protein